jgi:hypothetical protein
MLAAVHARNGITHIVILFTGAFQVLILHKPSHMLIETFESLASELWDVVFLRKTMELGMHDQWIMLRRLVGVFWQQNGLLPFYFCKHRGRAGWHPITHIHVGVGTADEGEHSSHKLWVIIREANSSLLSFLLRSAYSDILGTRWIGPHLADFTSTLTESLEEPRLPQMIAKCAFHSCPLRRIVKSLYWPRDWLALVPAHEVQL